MKKKELQVKKTTKKKKNRLWEFQNEQHKWTKKTKNKDRMRVKKKEKD